ncbi:hypothetical protein MKK68_07655 [Methylobacterium sp. E-016]|jgi:hypothetical protein|uniref:hypothetical protein n=1 Tax=Methylobacterium sp. E-016 TaxID=2836556 RepID=UPI001FB92C66|nr:hypothetical protein [Methylobacterium sp. E-016]MCJ2075533.1 hypothetical protein [Methylobacterium sp. E-016]
MKIIFTLTVLAAFTLPAHAIEGRYKVEGQNPGQPQLYKGEAMIKRTGDTYSVVWQIGSGRQVGTGILTGTVLSVVFQAAGSPGSGGVASFQIIDDKVATGKWAVTGGQTVGSEKWSLESGI